MKMLIASILVALQLCAAGCNNSEQPHATPEPTSTRYATTGRYDGLFTWIDANGHKWRYRTSGEEVYVGMPVYICFDDNATPDKIYDDKIIGIVFDRETAIYDDLEASLSESFELEREGNNIRIHDLKVK